MPSQNVSIYIRTIKLAVVIVGILAIKYNDRGVFYEHRKGIISTKGWPLLGRLIQFLRNRHRLHEFFLDSFTEMKSLTLASSSIGFPVSILTIDPRNIEHVLKDNFENYIKSSQLNDAMGEVLGHGIFNSNGAKWKYQRKTASHIFSVKNFRSHYTKVFLKQLDVLFDNILDTAAKDNTCIDFHNVMFKYTMDSFVLLGFGRQIHTLSSLEEIPFATSFNACQKNAFKRFSNPIWRITERLGSVFMPWRTSIYDHIHTVQTFANTIVADRRQKVKLGEELENDLLSRFMNTRNERGELLSNEELRDLVLNFTIAGRDTTAQSLSWIFYMLLSHPDVEEKLLAEANEMIDSSLAGEPELLYDAVKNMVYAHAIIHETLRLYPVVPINQKFALNDDIWPDGSVIKKGDYIFWFPWAQGRSEEIWGSDAKEFRPERWITEEGKFRRESSSQWPAFHAGPRICLGSNLATLQLLVTMTFIVKRYKLSLVPDQGINYEMSLTLPMKNGMKVFVTKR